MKLDPPKLQQNATTEDFHLFLRDFEEMIIRQQIHPTYRLKYLVQAVQDTEVKRQIKSNHSSDRGLQIAIKTLKTKYGDEECLKVEKMRQVDQFSYDTKTADGLFKLSSLINSILSNEAFNGEWHRGSFLFQRIIGKIPIDTQDKYSERVFKDQQNLESLGEFLELLAENKTEQEKRRKPFTQPRESQNQKPTYKSKHYSSKISEKPKSKPKGQCYICGGPHFVFYCLRDKPRDQVEKIARENRLCFNCFSDKHGVRECESKQRCRKCEKKHNTLLHKEGSKGNDVLAIENKVSVNDIKIENYAIRQKRNSKVEKLLPVKYSAFVVPAYVRNMATGQVEETIAYHDQGADETWISTKLSKKLKLKPLTTSDCTITTVTGVETYKNTPIVELKVESLDKTVGQKLRCRVMDEIPKECTYKNLSTIKKKYPYLSKVPVRDTTADEVGICIGRDNCHLLNHEEIVQGKKNQPIAYKMKLGWTICIPRQQDDETASIFFRKCTTVEAREQLEDAFSNARQYAIKANLEAESKPLVWDQAEVEDTPETLVRPQSLDEITNEAMRKLLTEDNLIIEEKPPFNKAHCSVQNQLVHKVLFYKILYRNINVTSITFKELDLESKK